MPARANIFRLVRSRYRSRWRNVCSFTSDEESCDDEEAKGIRGALVTVEDDDESFAVAARI
jgi:hypothetical protein